MSLLGNIYDRLKFNDGFSTVKQRLHEIAYPEQLVPPGQELERDQWGRVRWNTEAKTGQELAMSRMYTLSKADLEQEAFGNEKILSDRKKHENRIYLLTNDQPSQEENFQGYQDYEHHLTEVRKHVNGVATSEEGNEVFSKSADLGVLRAAPGSIRILAGRLEYDQNDLESERATKDIAKGLGYLKRLQDFLNKKDVDAVTGAAGILLRMWAVAQGQTVEDNVAIPSGRGKPSGFNEKDEERWADASVADPALFYLRLWGREGAIKRAISEGRISEEEAIEHQLLHPETRKARTDESSIKYLNGYYKENSPVYMRIDTLGDPANLFRFNHFQYDPATNTYREMINKYYGRGKNKKPTSLSDYAY